MTSSAAESATRMPTGKNGSQRKELILRLALNLLIFLSFFQNGLTVLLNVKLRLIGFLILVVLFAKGLFSSQSPLRLFEKAMLVWFGTGVLSGLFDFRYGINSQVAYSLAYNLIFEFGWIMAFFAGKYAGSQGVNFRKVMAWTLFFGIVLTGLAILEKFFHEYVELYLLATSNNAFIQENFNSVFRRGYGYDESAYRCVSFVLEFISFSYLCGILTLAFLVLFLEFRKFWYLVGLITSVSALFLTQSLASLAACCLCALLYLFVVKRMKISHLIYVGLACGVFMTAFAFQKEGASPFEGIQNRITSVASGKDEGLITHFHNFQFGVIDNFTAFGHGLGTADFLHGQMARQMEDDEYPTIEHEYFRILFEVGGIGFLVYLFAIGLATKQSMILYQRETDPWRKCIAVICALWLIEHLLVGFAHRAFPNYESTIFPALLFGFLYATTPTPLTKTAHIKLSED